MANFKNKICFNKRLEPIFVVTFYLYVIFLTQCSGGKVKVYEVFVILKYTFFFLGF